ncbi:MAG: hypothetical protein U0575_11395 [Phycisphaerales bacterium]
MIYRVVRAVHRGYALTVFWIYVAAFAVAFCFMFILPFVTISLLFVAIFGLALAYFGEMILRGSENLLARASLRRGVCPICRGSGELSRSADGRLGCLECASLFERHGAEVDPDALDPAPAG